MVVDEDILRRLVKRFLEENAKLNLSAFRSEEHCWVGNVLDSIALLQAFDAYPQLKTMTSLVDIGTGGGFPLVPLGICLPKVQCLGIDATQKKVDAVRRIVESLGVTNVSLLCGRIESLAHSAEHREKADLVTARAVAPLAVLLEYAVPLLKVGGLCAFWKSTKVADELAGSAGAQRALKCLYLGAFNYTLPDQWGDRTIVFFKKTAATPSDYPRRTGIPKQKPIA
jgi:16S rRNA (guanine527-N7)-methyltransferase